MHTRTIYRTWRMPPTPSRVQRWQDICLQIMAPLTIWICVSVGIRYGCFGDSHMVLGPSSSRLMKANSVFVKQIKVANSYKNEVALYAFNEKPELNSQRNWSTTNFLLVAAYSREGISLWLNKGSTVRLRWEAPTGILSQIEGVVIKGERRFKKLQPKQTVSPDAITNHEPINGKEAEYNIEEDDRYQVGVINMNSRNIVVTIRVNVSAKVYDITKAKDVCSTAKRSCGLSLLFPYVYHIILAAPNSESLGGWDVEVSFVARVLTYIALLGFIIIVIFLILKYLGACFGGDHQTTSVTVDTRRFTRSVVVLPRPQEVTETEPMVQTTSRRTKYGTNEEDDEEESDASSSSSEDLYDEKLCVICYDEQRNCFFVPCGHCATCYDCAQRIVDREGKVCPICRRLIHKARRLFHS